MQTSRACSAGSLWSAILLFSCPGFQPAHSQTPADAAAAQKAMASRISAATQLGPQQAALAQYLGRWTVDIALPGQGAHSTGTAEYSWVIEGRWLGCRIKGTVLGQPFEEFTILGYDTYAQSVVEVSVQSADNSMLMARGASGGSQPTAELFGELDENITGSVHRPYKVVMRWLSADRHVTEIWDVGGDKPVEKLAFTFSRGG